MDAEQIHRAVVKHALQTGERIGDLFDKLGNAQHPRGAILSAYRTAARAITQAGIDNPIAVDDALSTLRLAGMNTTRELLTTAADIGTEQANRDLSLWSLPPATTSVAVDISAALLAVGATMDAQFTAIRAKVRLGNSEVDEIVGGLVAVPIILVASDWLATLVNDSYVITAEQSAARDPQQRAWGRQAVAAIDERTTDCCLRVSGQVVPITGLFKLTGRPRYADEMSAPPFHRKCRTTIALVLMELANDPMTREMRAAARDELKAREDGSRKEIHPANALSRRG